MRNVNPWGSITFKVAPCLSSLPNASVNVIKHQLYLPAARGCLTFHAIWSWCRNLWHQPRFCWFAVSQQSCGLEELFLLYLYHDRFKEGQKTLSNWATKPALSRADVRNRIRFDVYESNYLLWLRLCLLEPISFCFCFFLFFPNVALKSLKQLFYVKCLFSMSNDIYTFKIEQIQHQFHT